MSNYKVDKYEKAIWNFRDLHLGSCKRNPKKQITFLAENERNYFLSSFFVRQSNDRVQNKKSSANIYLYYLYSISYLLSINASFELT